MRIGEVATKSNVGVETIRFYERKGLVTQPQKPACGGYRDYPTDVVHRINFIRCAQELGFSLSEITELLELVSGHGVQCDEVRRRTEIKRQEIVKRIDNLRLIAGALDELIDACPGEGPLRSCSILDAIGRGYVNLKPLKERQSDDRQEKNN